MKRRQYFQHILAMCTSTSHRIADPNDDMLDVVGFDTATPQLIAEFIGS